MLFKHKFAFLSFLFRFNFFVSSPACVCVWVCLWQYARFNDICIWLWFTKLRASFVLFYSCLLSFKKSDWSELRVDFRTTSRAVITSTEYKEEEKKPTLNCKQRINSTNMFICTFGNFLNLCNSVQELSHNFFSFNFVFFFLFISRILHCLHSIRMVVYFTYFKICFYMNQEELHTWMRIISFKRIFFFCIFIFVEQK